jgi:hypothetical protein
MNGMKQILAASIAAASLVHSGWAADGSPAFTSEPKVTAGKDGVKIEFAVARATDVAVEILDAKGDTVRHLGAGLLGENAPEPFQPGALAQSLAWDRTDDLGRDAPAGEYFVRIGLGLKPALKKVENFEPLNAGAIQGLSSMPGGGVCVLNGRSARLIVADRDGAYVRQVFPPPASLDPEQAPGLRVFRRGDGRWVPMLDDILAAPAGAAAYSPMAAGGGRLAVASSGAAPLRIIDLASGAISAPIGTNVIGQGKGLVSPRSLAVSPDGKWVYLTGVEAAGKQVRALHAVYRLSADGSAALAPLAGDPEKADKTEVLLRNPVGVACDKSGNILVCDNANDRIVSFSSDGKFVRALEVKAPVFAQALPDGGICALCATGTVGAARGFPLAVLRLVRLAADGRELAAEVLKAPNGVGKPQVTGLAVDAGKEPAVVLVSLSGEAWPMTAGALLRAECRERGLAAIAPVAGNYKQAHVKGPYDPRALYNWGVNDPSYQKYQELFDWKQLADEGAPWYSLGPLNARTGLWADGRAYRWNDWVWYHTKTANMHFLRYNPDKTPAPFVATQTNFFALKYEQNAPWFAQRGTMVDRRGHVYVRYSWSDPLAKTNGLDPRNQWVTGVLHYNETGSLTGEVALTHGTYGLGTDVRGNIYVGDKPRPAGILVPADIEKAFDGKVPESIAGWYGSVIKFGPAGGRFLFKKVQGRPKDLEARRPGDLFRPPLKTMDADIGPWLNGGQQADIEGAQWVWVGMSPMITTKACICYGTSLAVDPHGRIFAPDKIACRVAVLDANGNLIRYLGSYGNMDSRGKDSPVPDPEIAFAGLRQVTAATSRQVRTADSANGWVSVINLGYEQEARVPLALGARAP